MQDTIEDGWSDVRIGLVIDEGAGRPGLLLVGMLTGLTFDGCGAGRIGQVMIGVLEGKDWRSMG